MPYEPMPYPTASSGPPTSVAPAAAPTAAAPVPASTGNPVVEKWRQFMGALKTDPNLRMAFIQTGLGLMQSPQMGQSGWDVAGGALNRGVQTLDLLRQRQRTQKIEEEDRTFEKDVKKRNVEVAERNVKVYERTGNAQAAAQEFMNSPEVQDIKMKLLSGEIDEREAEIRLKNSQASYYGRMPKESSTGSDLYSSLFDSGKGGFDVRAAEAIYEDLKSRFPNEKPEVLRRKAYEEQQRRKGDRVNLEQAEARIQDLAKQIAFGLIPASEEDMKNPYQAAARMYREEQGKLRAESGRVSQVPPAPGIGAGNGVVPQSQVGRTVPVRADGKTVAGVVVGETTDSVSIKLPDGSTKAVAKDQFIANYGMQ